MVTSEVPSGKLDIFKESHIQSKGVLDATHWIHVSFVPDSKPTAPKESGEKNHCSTEISSTNTGYLIGERYLEPHSHSISLYW